jgi:hypothetical protein
MYTKFAAAVPPIADELGFCCGDAPGGQVATAKILQNLHTVAVARPKVKSNHFDVSAV